MIKKYITKKKILQVILLILNISVFMIIFGFSSQNGEQSDGISREISTTIVEITNNGQELEEINMQEKVDSVDRVIRKLAHFSLYTILGITLMSFVSTIEMRDKKRGTISVIIGMLYATSDEIHQIFTLDRSPHVTDVMIDTMGVIFGILIVMLVVKIYQEKFSKKHK